MFFFFFENSLFLPSVLYLAVHKWNITPSVILYIIKFYLILLIQSTNLQSRVHFDWNDTYFRSKRPEAVIQVWISRWQHNSTSLFPLKHWARMPRISKSSSMISDQLRVGSYGCPTFPQIITMCLSLVKALLGFSHNKGVSPYSLGFGFLETGNPHISALVLLTSYKTVLLLFVLLCNKKIFFLKPLTIYCSSVKK